MRLLGSGEQYACCPDPPGSVFYYSSSSDVAYYKYYTAAVDRSIPYQFGPGTEILPFVYQFSLSAASTPGTAAGTAYGTSLYGSYATLPSNPLFIYVDAGGQTTGAGRGAGPSSAVFVSVFES